MLASVWQKSRHFAAIIIVTAIISSIVVTNVADAQEKTYPPNRDGAMQFANDFCAANAKGLADYVWLSAPGSEDDTTITVTSPNTTATVRVNIYTRPCSAYPSGVAAGSTYTSDRGGIIGAFNYQNNYPGGSWYSFEHKILNVNGWDSGSHTICMTLETWTDAIGFKPKRTPSACSVLNLNVIYPWQTSGWSRIGVNSQPNVTNWPANPPGSEKPTQPGDRLYWRHGVYNTGPGSAGSISFAIGKSGFTNGWTGNIDPQGAFPLGADQTWEVGYQRSWPEYSVYDVQQNDVGNTLCESISWWPWKYDDGAGRNSSQWTGVPGGACTTVPYNFTLTPTVDVNVEAAESGTPIQVTSSISNSGPTKSLDDTEWRLFKFVLAPGASIPSAGESGSACPPVWTGCGAPQAQGSGIFGVSPATTNLPTVDYTVEDLELGSQVCYGLSVNKFAGSRGSNKGANNWWNGAPDCMVVGKKPKVQIWGGDAAVRGNIQTSTTT